MQLNKHPTFCNYSVRSKRTFLLIISFFLCMHSLVYRYFRPFVQFVCVNSGVYSFLLVFAPSLAFLCCFIFISAFVSSYRQFYFSHVLAYFLHIVVFQYSVSLHFGLCLAQFSPVYSQLVSSRSQFALQQLSLAETMLVFFTVLVFFGLLFLYCNFLLFTVLVLTHALSSHFVALNFHTLSSWFSGVIFLAKSLTLIEVTHSFAVTVSNLSILHFKTWNYSQKLPKGC